MHLPLRQSGKPWPQSRYALSAAAKPITFYNNSGNQQICSD
jgi:hypothetical protein